VALRSAIDYAGACSAQRDGRCFRVVYDDQGKPARCPKPLTVTAGVKIGRWYEVDACEEHAAQLRQRRQRANYDRSGGWDRKVTP